MCVTMRWWILILVVQTSACAAAERVTAGAMYPDVNVDDSSVTELIKNLTIGNSYDRQLRPVNVGGGPLVVQCRVFIFYLKSLDAPNLQFTVHMLLQLRWRDKRLEFTNLTNASEIVGEKWLLDYIWAPHIYFANERDSLVMKGMTSDKDQLINILPEGDVFYTTRLKTTMMCRMKQGKFPFDQQKCHIIMDSWRYNASHVMLQWEKHDPALIPNNNPSLAEYYLLTMNHHNSEELCCGHHSAVNPRQSSHSYSSLVLTFVLQREFGFYIMDYYVPSIILVILTWVSFWLEPDATPARSLLGVSTMLTFIMLKAGTKSIHDHGLHFRTNDVWFIGITAFIFFSLVEFAFVNTIHRQEVKRIRLKNASSRNILRTALSPNMMRKRRSSSCPTTPLQMHRQFNKSSDKNTYLTVNNFEGLHLAIQLKELGKRQEEKAAKEKSEITDKTVMTTHEIARWIDRRSRAVFPIGFLIFNLFYWTFMFI